MSQRLKTIVENTFIDGYNDSTKPEDLRKIKGKYYMADIKNAFIEENKLVKRKGYATIGNASKTKKVLGQSRHEPSGGSKYVLRAINNSGDTQSTVEGWSGTGNWAELTGGDSQTADLNHEFVMAENATYIFNGTDTVLKTTNGTSTSTVAAIPIGTQAKWWHNYFWVMGVTGNKSRLYFSDVNEPETFDAVNGFIDINTDDNEELIGLGALKDTLFIFKASSIFQLTGYGTGDFTLADLNDFGTGVGTIAPRSIVETGNDIYYISFRGQTPHIKSVQRTREGFFTDGGVMSDNITGTMNRIVKGQIENTAGVYDGRRIWFAITTTGTTNNEVIVMDELTKGWVRLDGVNASVIHISSIGGSYEIYFGDATATGLSYVFNNSATSDNSAAIDFLVDSPMYQPRPGRKSRFKYLYVTASVSSDVDIDVDNSPDGFTFNDLKTISLTGEGAAFGSAIFGTSKFGATSISRVRADFAGGSAYYMQYRLRNNKADEDVSIREWELMYSERGLRAT